MIRFEQVSRSFTVGDQQVAALRGIDLDIAAGDYVFIMGPPGSGKFMGAGSCINTLPQKPNAKNCVTALYYSCYGGHHAHFNLISS